MGYKLISDIAVDNSSNYFDKYLSKYGLMSQNMGNFIENYESTNSELTQSQFDALMKFEERLIELGVWGNILEVVPLIGTNINSMAVKYKGKNNSIMNPLGGISDVQVEPNKGLLISSQKESNAYGFDLGLKYSDIMTKQGLGVSAFGRKHGSDASYTDYIIGIKGGSKSISSKITIAGAALTNNFLESSNIVNQILNSQEFRFHTITRLNNNKVILRHIYNNSTKVLDSSSAVVTTPLSSDGNLYLGCINDLTTGNINGYFGRLRMCVLNDGDIPLDSVNEYISICNDLYNDLGKNIY